MLASVKKQPALSLHATVVVTVAMALVYTAIDTAQPVEPLLSLLAFIPGVIGVLALTRAGFSMAELNLRVAPISRPGLSALAATTILLLPILGSTSAWIGWSFLPSLVYAPASGIAQELFFRSSLLPAIERAMGGRNVPALLVHSAIFVAFHFRTFRSISTLPQALMVALVLFLAGCGWGYQVHRDRTVVWAMIQHSGFLMLMSMFTWD